MVPVVVDLHCQRVDMRLIRRCGVRQWRDREGIHRVRQHRAWRGLGTGSTRLLPAGLQRKAANQSTILLMDELEHGLEPHGIIRLLGSIGAKEKDPPLQAFVTTHSPVVLQELSADQIMVVRKMEGSHDVMCAGSYGDLQGTIRTCPDAFLASSVVVCEGASEVGLIRGLDQYYVGEGYTSASALGVALVDAGGCDWLYHRVNAFRALRYRTTVVRDDDKQPAPDVEKEYIDSGGTLTLWRNGRALEDELFASLTDRGVLGLLDYAIELHGEELVDAHIRSAAQGKMTLASCRANLSPPVRSVLGRASRTKRAGWYKSVTWMEHVARAIVRPDLEQADEGFCHLIYDLFRWIENGGP